MFFAIGLVFLGLFFAFQRVTKGTKKVNYMSTPMVNAILPLEKTYMHFNKNLEKKHGHFLVLNYLFSQSSVFLRVGTVHPKTNVSFQPANFGTPW